MEVSVRHPKTHYDVISYHWVSKIAYFVEHDIGYQPSKFQCSRMSESNFTEEARVQYGLPPSDNLINMHKISKSPVFGFNSQLLANT